MGFKSPQALQIWNHTQVTNLQGPTLRRVQVQFQGQPELSVAGTAAERSTQTLCLSLTDPSIVPAEVYGTSSLKEGF